MTNSVRPLHMSQDLHDAITENIVSSTVALNEIKFIFRWVIAADVLLAILFICLIFGFMTVYVHWTIVETFLMFVGLILISHSIIEDESPAFVISGIVFGIILPTVMELWNIIGLFVFKKDFY